MKFYYHPVSTTCRPIMLLAAEGGIELDLQLVDLMTGAQYKPDFEAINPCHQVPVLDDDGFRLTESSAILKYLADKKGHASYPSDRRQRARIHERMDWFNTGFYRDFAYGYVYPQIFDFMRRPDAQVQAGTIAYGREKSLGWLKILDQHLLGPGGKFLCGDAISIADYLGSIMVLGGEAIGLNFAGYPNIVRWLTLMKGLRSWQSVNAVFYQYVVEPNKGKSFLTL
jgi:glutathione S-transferase